MAGEASAVHNKGWLYHPDYPDHWQRCPLYSLAEWVNGLAFRDIQFSAAGLLISGELRLTDAEKFIGRVV